jgi:hypothetical protein
MVPTAEHIDDATSTFTARTAPLHPRMPLARAQTVRLDAVAARLLVGYKARWHPLAGVAAFCALAALLLSLAHVL